jgi:hypothetical protein
MFSPEYFMNDLSRRYRNPSEPSAEIRQYCRIEGVLPESLCASAFGEEQTDPVKPDCGVGLLCADEK